MQLRRGGLRSIGPFNQSYDQISILARSHHCNYNSKQLKTSGVNDSWLIQGIHAGVPFMIIRMKIRVLHVKVLDLSLRWNQISTLITTGCSHYVIKMGNIILVATPSSPTCCSFTSCWLPGRAIWWWAGRLSLTETSSRKLANIGHIQEPPLQRSVADAYYARG